ncbi:MAG: tRNA (adenosine(37)-N6)-threonylcarbamoyltransferase complex ATPase subunit type 1 TsaE [Endomicrobiales bacterium]
MKKNVTRRPRKAVHLARKKASREKAVVSSSPEETRALGRSLSRLLKPGDIVFLSGQLGAGKTTFVQGVFQGFGIARHARSSSFILVNEYHTPSVTVFHLDLYRLGKADINGLGLEEYLYGKGVCLIEWADKIGRGCRPTWEVRLRWLGENKREIEIIKYKKG